MHETFNFEKKEHYLPGSLNNGNIAQLVEQGAVNAQVVGSEPTIPAKMLKGSLLRSSHLLKSCKYVLYIQLADGLNFGGRIITGNSKQNETIL